MKQFFKFMFASMAGFVLAGIVLMIIMFTVISGALMTFSPEKKTAVENNSILEINLNYAITENTSDNPFENFSFSSFSTEKYLGLNDIIKNIEKAERDENIKGIFLNLSGTEAGLATLAEIRDALKEFKKSGKFIYAYGEYMGQGAYYLASVADKVIIHPEGLLEFRGLHATLTFFKGTLEKLEIEPQVIRHGKFKSAVEPFVNEKMSNENREQISTFVNSVWNKMVEDIAEGRKLSTTELQASADQFLSRNPKAAVESKLIDEVAFYDEVIAQMQKLSGEEENSKPKLISLNKYDNASVKSDKAFSNRKIAVIYAVGEIVSGKGESDQIGSDKIAGEIRKARRDTSIRAIVLRVNSPGGSAIASDVILREMALAKKEKPVVVSMGDLAASGGYYIACNADTIVAQANTLTGSIGVFGILFNTEKMFKNKLGITFDDVKTNKFADLGTITRKLSSEEKEMIQQEVERIYETFITHVSDGRGISKEMVDSIGQGRIWSGTDAKRLGLVDVLGNLESAVEIAAGMAKLDAYRVISMPEQKEFFEKLMEDMKADAGTYFAKKELGEDYRYYKSIRTMLDNSGIQARIPFDVSFSR